MKCLFKGNFLNVFRDEKLLKNGKKIIFEKIKHPGASIIIPFVNEKIVFIRQYRVVIDKFIWELPAGTLEKREKPIVCAKRELEEETGFIAKEIKKIGNIYTSPGFCDEQIYIFKAFCYERRKTSFDDGEVISVTSFSKDKVKSLFKNGRIVDAKTISALAFANLL